MQTSTGRQMKRNLHRSMIGRLGCDRSGTMLEWHLVREGIRAMMQLSGLTNVRFLGRTLCGCAMGVKR